MPTLEKKLKKRSKILKKASKKYYDDIDKSLKEGWIIKGKDLNILKKAIFAVAQGELPKFSKKTAMRFQGVVATLDNTNKIICYI